GWSRRTSFRPALRLVAARRSGSWAAVYLHPPLSNRIDAPPGKTGNVFILTAGLRHHQQICESAAGHRRGSLEQRGRTSGNLPAATQTAPATSAANTPLDR